MIRDEDTWKGGKGKEKRLKSYGWSLGSGLVQS